MFEELEYNFSVPTFVPLQRNASVLCGSFTFAEDIQLSRTLTDTKILLFYFDKGGGVSGPKTLVLKLSKNKSKYETGQESGDCNFFISDVGIRDIYFSLTLGTAKFKQLD